MKNLAIGLMAVFVGVRLGLRAETTIIGAVEWNFQIGQKEATIIGCSILDDTVTSISMPAQLGGATVTRIGFGAFSHNTALTSIRIPDTVQTIESQAFYYCSGLKFLKVPSSVKSFGMWAFEGCSGLTNVVVEALVDGWSDSFGNCENVTSLTVPLGVSANARDSIGRKFRNVEYVEIVSGSKSIPYGCFNGCSRLMEITLPTSVENIGTEAFNNCYGLRDVDLTGDVGTIGDRAFQSCKALTNVTCRGMIREIGRNAFAACTKLESLSFNDGLETIAAYAFAECINLKSLKLPHSVSSIGSGAFNDCRSLELDLWLADGVDLVDSFAYSRMNCLRSISLPDGLRQIGSHAFSDCTTLTNVTFRGCVGCIEPGAFCGCAQLDFVTFPGEVDEVREFAFQDCTNLRVIEFNGSVERLERNVFYGCLNLVSIVVEGKGPYECDFTGAPRTCIVSLPVDVQRVAPGDTQIRIMKGSYDISGYLDVPTAWSSEWLDYGSATVKSKYLMEVLDTSKGAVVVIGSDNVMLKTVPTRPGLTYVLREGNSLAGMAVGESVIGDGTPWVPKISIKGGKAGFYSILVTK